MSPWVAGFALGMVGMALAIWFMRSGKEAETPKGPESSTTSVPIAPLPPEPPNPEPSRRVVDDGFRPLFNGRDLAGWKTHPSQPGDWKVVDGLLVGEGKGPSHLYTDRGDYQDFRIRWEVRVNAEGNSGVHLRSRFGPSFPAGAPRYPDGYEAAIYYGPTAPMRTGALYAGSKRAVEVADSPGRPGEWVRMEALARGDRVKVWVDGRLTADYADPDRAYRSGHIALQCHDEETRVEFRSIEIEELTTEEEEGAASLASAEPLGEFLYKDDFGDVNSGWQRNEGAVEGSSTPFRRDYESGVYFLEAPAKWSGFEAWNCTGELAEEFQFEAVARSVGPETAYGAFALIVTGAEGRGFQVSINAGGKLAVYDSPWGSSGRHYFEPFRHPEVKGGEQWNTLTLRLRKRSLEVLVNGEAVVPPIATDYDLLPSTPQIAIVKGDDSRLRAEFDRVQIRKLLGTTPVAGGAPARILYTDDFEEPGSGWHRGRTQSDGGLTANVTDYANGSYFFRAEPGWMGTSMAEYMVNPAPAGPYEVEVVGRVLGPAGVPGSWGTMLVREDGRGLHVVVDRQGTLQVFPAFWGVDRYPNDRSSGPMRPAALRPADQWNTLTLRVRDREMAILVNGQEVGEPFRVDYDLLPSRPAFTGTKPDYNTRILTEFDRVQVRLLP